MSPPGQVREQIAYVRSMYAYAYRFPLVTMDLTRQVPDCGVRARHRSASI